MIKGSQCLKIIHFTNSWLGQLKRICRVYQKSNCIQLYTVKFLQPLTRQNRFSRTLTANRAAGNPNSGQQHCDDLVGHARVGRRRAAARLQHRHPRRHQDHVDGGRQGRRAHAQVQHPRPQREPHLHDQDLRPERDRHQ